VRIKRILKITSLVVLILAIIGGAVWMLDYLAVINVRETARKIPVVGKIVPEDKQKKPKTVTVNPLEEKVKALTAEIEKQKENAGELEQRVEVLNKEKQSLLEERDSLKTALESLKTLQEEQETAKLGYENLAKYYMEMKPEAVVKIMDNLPDEVNIGILQYLEEEKVAKILGAMDPVKAANLTDKMRQ